MENSGLQENSPRDDRGLTPLTLQRPWRFQFSLRTALVVMTLIAVTLGCYLWVQQRHREARRHYLTRMSFLMTYSSLDHYNYCYHRLPFLVRREAPDFPTNRGNANGTGKALYSWRAEVALCRDCWFKGNWDPAATWDSPANKEIADFPWQFCYDGLLGFEWPKEYSKQTCMMAITGPGTAFGCPEDTPMSLKAVPKNTILVVEVRNSGLHWMEPGDLDIRTMPRTINASDGKGISSRYRGGFHVLFADGAVWFISETVPFSELEKLFTIEGGKQHDRQAVLGPYLLDR